MIWTLVRWSWIPLLAAFLCFTSRRAAPAANEPQPGPIVTEFLAADESVLPDSQGRYSGWIEVHNPGPADMDLGGWYLTDNERDLKRWQFPPTTLPADGYLVVFASGLEDQAGAELHANFRLANAGEYLALVQPDGDTIAWQYGPPYPPQFEDISYGLVPAGPAAVLRERYLTAPTPGAANDSSQDNLGPILDNVRHTPTLLRTDDSLTVAVAVEETAAPIEEVTLHTRVMYGPTIPVPMDDDGKGTYVATIPSGLYGPGDMVRYAITARDSQGRTSRWPLYHDPLNSPQYMGTVVADPDVDSNLPVLYWFVQDTYAASTDEGTRASVFYIASGQLARPSVGGQASGVLYDNVLVRRRGVTSKSWAKKSFKFDFNQGYHFVHSTNQPPVEEFNLMSTYDDKAYIRQPLAWETYRDAGVPYCISFPLRVQQNGAFHSVATFVEQPGPRYLERQGLDPDGALYKVGLNAFDSSTKGLAKVTRQDEDRSDLQTAIAGVHLSGQERTSYLFDHFNIPAIVNYMATTAIIADRDWGHKNYYIYRDTEGTGEWTILPWDKDLTFGRHYLDEYGGTFNDIVWADHDPESHPLHFYTNSELVDALLDTPAIREMYLRRLRTLMDEYLQPPGTSPTKRYYETRIDALYVKMLPDVIRDARRWPVAWGAPQTFEQALNILKIEYLDARRVHLYETHGPPNQGIVPHAQPSGARVEFGPMEPDPASRGTASRGAASGDQDEEYLTLINPNDFAVDLSGWRIAHDIEYTFQPGTVLPPGGILYLSPDVVAFRARATSPTGGEGRFVQGDYRGRLSNRWGLLVLYDEDGRVAARKLFFNIY